MVRQTKGLKSPDFIKRTNIQLAVNYLAVNHTEILLSRLLFILSKQTNMLKVYYAKICLSIIFILKFPLCSQTILPREQENLRIFANWELLFLFTHQETTDRHKQSN